MESNSVFGRKMTVVATSLLLTATVVAGHLPRLEDADLDVFLREVYGKRPVERPADMEFCDLYPPETFERNPQCGPSRPIDARRRILICRYKGPYGEGSFRFTVFLPKEKSGPVPAFVLICNRNPGVNIDPWRVSRTGFWPAEEIVDRGYGAIAFWNEEVAVDSYSADYAFKSGVFRCFEDPSAERTDDAWGCVSAWAWGASRIMDWIETCPQIDARHVAVVGHSRGGKAALVAGITDRRFAMAVANCSGCGGAKLNRADLPQSEHIAQILQSVPYWFCRNFGKYSGRDAELPFDQHQWLSLMAPRLLYVSSGTLDHWAGPEGEKQATDLARPAWGSRRMDDVGYHIHEGKHDLTAYDWGKFLDFADAHGWKGAE